MARFEVDEVVGNMRILEYKAGKITSRGLIPYYVCECENCGMPSDMSHETLLNRKRRGMTKCRSCYQDEPEEEDQEDKPYVGYKLNVPYELFKQFISQR